ncbi:MAG TPA: Lrp/AsnC ligand binding domain-containing protein [Candidatus Thermoplasmatota archaeon]|nr:Lrp/AsnC ligand binding domain-containing protein [Candidatus Thermoplasmatota archaeon]
MAIEELFFVRAHAAQVREIFQALSSEPRVRHVAITTGAWDLFALVSGGDRPDLDRFHLELLARPGIEAVERNPVEKRWENPGGSEKTIQAWTIVRTRARELTFQDLQGVENIHEVLSTASTDVLARFSGDSFEEVHNRVLEGVGRAGGVERTTTFLSTQRRKRSP